MSGEIGIATVLKTGPGASVQDLGRRGNSKFGVPSSGVLDLRSFRWINHLLQNQENEAVLEISQPGFSIQFDSVTLIALAGASANVKLNGQEIENSGLIFIKRNDILEIGAISYGARIYLGIRFVFKSEKLLGSRRFFEELSELGIIHRAEIHHLFPAGTTKSPLFNGRHPVPVLVAGLGNMEL